jgi:hypothetical protein
MQKMREHNFDKLKMLFLFLLFLPLLFLPKISLKLFQNITLEIHKNESFAKNMLVFLGGYNNAENLIHE